MATGLCNKYNLFNEIGQLGGSENTDELNLQRAQVVKEWFKTHYNDIIEVKVVDNTVSHEVFVDCYFRGMTSGIYFLMGTGSTAGANAYGIIKNGNRTYLENGVKFCNGEMNFFIALSKYGFITGFYTKDFRNIRSCVINRNTALICLFVGNSSNSNTIEVINNSVSNVYTEYKRGNATEVVLVEDNIPFTDFIPTGIYKSVGAAVSNLAEYRIGNGNNYYCEIIGYGTNYTGYRSYSLLLEEATMEDYANIPRRLTIEEGE